MKKRGKILALALTGALSMGLLSGCGKQEKVPTVKLSVWTDEGSLDVITEILDEFKKENKKEANFEFNVSVESTNTCKETILSNPEGAADVFTFADDQLNALKNIGALHEVTIDADAVLDAAGGNDSSAARACVRDGKLYSYPLNAGNGYFLYYNKGYFSKEDVETLDGILKVCADNGKKMAFDYSSGWYIYSFFKGAGLDVYSNDEGTQNICNWNATDKEYNGVDVAEAMSVVAANPGFLACDDQAFVEGVKKGEIIAGVNGAWNAETLLSVWGDGYAATKLPTYTICGEQKQMCSFIGYKMLGVSAFTKYPEWSMKLAEYITNEKNQLRMFENSGECPANLKAAENEKVQASPAIVALSEQSQYAYMQSVLDTFWTPASVLGITLSSGNLDDRDIQELLDRAVQDITLPVDSN